MTHANYRGAEIRDVVNILAGLPMEHAREDLAVLLRADVNDESLPRRLAWNVKLCEALRIAEVPIWDKE